MPPRDINVDSLTLRSLLLECSANGQALGTSTGFVVESAQKQYLITNWHVLAGRDPDTKKPLSDTGGIPDEITVVHHRIFEHEGHRATGWVPVTQPLLRDGSPLWHEHPDGSSVDIAALEVTVLEPAIQFYPLDLALADTDIFVGVGMPVVVVGFPLGLTGGAVFPIWKTGHVASEPEVDFDGRPLFLIDATTRSGMSGSPVYFRFGGHGYQTRNRIAMVGPGVVSVMSGEKTRFLGVYAGRIHGDAEIGRIWKPHVITELLSHIASQTSDDVSAETSQTPAS